MNQPPERLITLLAQLVADGVLTLEQATEIGARWREIRNLDDVLSMPVTDGVTGRPRPQEEEDDDRLILLLLLAALAAAYRPVTVAGRQQLAAELATMGAHARIGTLNALQDAHAAAARQLAARLISGDLSVADWQAALLSLNRRTTTGAAILGAGGDLSPAMLARLETINTEQAAYLQRFADELAGRMLAGQMPEDVAAALGLPGEWSEGYIGHRAATYTGASRGAYFEAYQTDGEGGEMERGTIVYYEAVDDPHTCSDCHDAQGPYLIGANPYPGQLCAGGGACRCWLEYVYDPVLYHQLGGT